MEALGIEPAELVSDVRDRVAVDVRAEVDLSSRILAGLVDATVEALGERQSSWRPAEVVRELAGLVPTTVADRADDLVAWLDQTAATIAEERMLDISGPVPDGVRLRRDGRPVTESVLDRAFTTAEILAQEQAIHDWATARLATGGADRCDVIDRSKVELSGGQAQTAAAVAGDRSLVIVVGPAGTGKTTALQPAVAQLNAEHRAVFGVTSSAVAADVLAVETGVMADTIDKLLYEHHKPHGPSPEYVLPAGTTVIVDEAGTISTPKLAELAVLADARRWRVVLVGDPLQFSAVGRSGMFDALVDTHGAIELDRVHRFTNGWERDASLRLRHGDITVLDVYAEHDRIHPGHRLGTERAVLRAWAQANMAGETVALVAATNTTVIRLNELVQAWRLAHDQLDPARTVAAGPYQVHVGDLIVTRHNDRQLLTDRGLMVKNRDTWTITHTHPDGRLTVTGRTGTLTLPADYVEAHVELGYAQTAHASQGRTVDRSILIVDGPVDTAGIYVPMTRGRHSNDVYVIAEESDQAIDILTSALTQRWIDTPATIRAAQLADLTLIPEWKAIPLSGMEIRALLERDHQLTSRIDGHDYTHNDIARQLDNGQTRYQQLTREVTTGAARCAAAHETLDRYDRAFHRHGHIGEINRARTTLGWLPRRVEELRGENAQLADELHGLRVKQREHQQQAPQRQAWDTERSTIRADIHRDHTARLDHVRHHSTRAITDQLGARPTDRHAADQWDYAAARVDRHHNAYGHDHQIAQGRTAGYPYTAQAISAADTRRAIDQLTHTLHFEHDRSLGIDL